MTTIPPASHVLITGGSAGIGFALAERFLAAGHKVLITGRDATKLLDAAVRLPGVETFVNDLGKSAERDRLAAHVAQLFPQLNVLINNAGIQRRVSLAEDQAPWAERQVELDILLAAPIHLNSLLIPGMLQHGQSCRIVNVTSGGAYVPQPFAPVYSACKAALHSYTVTLRHALQNTSIEVSELAPPAVQTSLAGLNASHGAPVGDFADKVFADLISGEHPVIGYGPTDSEQFRVSLGTADAVFAANASRFPVKLY